MSQKTHLFDTRPYYGSWRLLRKRSVSGRQAVAQPPGIEEAFSSVSAS